MKISFSTLGCPDFAWNDVCTMAKDLGYQGVEVRGLGEDLFSAGVSPFSQGRKEETRKKLKDMKLEIACFSSGRCLKYGENAEENYGILTRYIDLAEYFGTRFVRILADESAVPDGEVDDELVVRQLKALAPLAEESGVTLVVETNGVYSDTKRLASLLAEVGSDNVAALWDIQHPYRNFGESPEQTVQNLGAYIRHVHAKDSIVKDGEIRYRLMGEGDLPIDAMMLALRSVNYEGFVSFEWLKKWSPELENAGVVFPHFANFMQQYLGMSGSSHILYDDERHTGKYFWPKEHLIDLTFPQLLDRVCEEFPDQYAFRYTTLDYTRTYAEFREDVDRFARSLIALGVKAGDHVAIWATNVPAWYITFWATTKIGAVLVTVNTAYKIHEAEYLLRQSDTHTLVMTDGYKDSDYVAIIRELCPELETTPPGHPLHMKRLPFLRNIITVESKQKGCLTWGEALALSNEVPVETVYRRASAVDKHDVCNMQYTSGTTGFPKGVMLTHYNVVNNGKAIGDCMDLSTADKMMIQVPMFHCFGMVLAMTASVTHGVTMCPI
ncbi:MAG: AMP-binding protein, partial [Oscillospiraceae bacterium]|nr:AMP-binding protein [Oscillospiraceae bacterium]